jgi:hypothetical protein
MSSASRVLLHERSGFVDWVTADVSAQFRGELPVETCAYPKNRGLE